MKPGQKVVCIKTTRSKEAVKGEIYTIKNLRYDDANDLGLILYEISPGVQPEGIVSYAFSAKKFRLVDYTFGEIIAEFIEEIILEES